MGSAGKVRHREGWQMEAVTTCLVGCGVELEPMARWAPYRTCPTCGSGFYAPPPAPTYWGTGVRPSEQQDQRWTERARQWEPVVGRGPGRVLDVGCGFGHFVRWAAGAAGRPGASTPTAGRGQQTVADPSRVVGDLDDAPGPVRRDHAAGTCSSTPRTRWRSPGRSARGSRPAAGLVVCSPDFEALQLRWWWLRRSPPEVQGVRASPRARHAVHPQGPRTRAPAGRVRHGDPGRAAAESAGRPGLDLLASRIPRLRTGLFVEARNTF